MRILILDDDQIRHDTFALAFEGETVRHAFTVDAACAALLNEGPWDLVHLDHDLNDHGHESKTAGMYGNQELTGFDVARFIARELSEEKRPQRIVVHSWNPPGARMMVDVLRDAGFRVTYEPFKASPKAQIDDLVDWFEQEAPLVDGLPTSASPPSPPPDNNEQGG